MPKDFFDPLGPDFDPFAGSRSGTPRNNDVVTSATGIAAQIARAVVHGQQRREMRATARAEREAMDDLVASPPPVHGSAAWATASELQASGILRGDNAFDDPGSILLGALQTGDRPSPEGWLHWRGEGHLITVAPTRSGKSTMQIVPNLLRYRGSCVVLDPKGELYNLTAGFRSTLGPVYRVAPFDAQTHAFNPFESVRSQADARALASLMIPEDPQSQEYFRKDAISFLSGLIQYVVEGPPGAATMAQLRTMTALPINEFMEMAKWMSLRPNSMVANAGNIVLSKSRDRGIPSLRDTLNSELSLWEDPGVQAATSRADFQFGDLKEGTATVYISIPFHKMAAFAPFQRVLLANALDAMVQNPTVPKIPVLFVLDEFLSLGSFPEFRDAIRTHAGAGVRLWFFLQNLSTLEELYPTSWRAFFDAAVQIFFGTGDIHTGGVVSELLGDTTEATKNTSYSLGASFSQSDFFQTSVTDSLNVSHSVNITARKLLTPAEVVQRLSGTRPDKTRDAIISIAGSRPIAARLVPYFLGTRSSQLAGMPLVVSPPPA